MDDNDDNNNNNNKDDEDFTVEALIRAMVLIKPVLSAFQRECRNRHIAAAAASGATIRAPPHDNKRQIDNHDNHDNLNLSSMVTSQQQNDDTVNTRKLKEEKDCSRYTSDSSIPDDHYDTTIDSQNIFATMISPMMMERKNHPHDDDNDSIDKNDDHNNGPLLVPSQRYLRTLVRSYIRRLEQLGVEPQDDALLYLVLQCSLTTDSVVPDAMESGYQSFAIRTKTRNNNNNNNNNNNATTIRNTSSNEENTCGSSSNSATIPLVSPSSQYHEVQNTGTGEDKQLGNSHFSPPSSQVHPNQEQQELLHLLVYPHHNDLSLRLWEAGGVLAEYLVQYPQHVQNKAVLETGSGVGLTGLVVAKHCHPTSVTMTDYTMACLHNLQHNIQINTTWFTKPTATTTTTTTIRTANENDGDNTKTTTSTTTTSSQNTTTLPSIHVGFLDWETIATAPTTTTTTLHHNNNNNNNEDDDDAENGPHDDSGIMNTSILLKDDPMVSFFQNAQVLLAADVVYDVKAVPWLAKTVDRFLTSQSSNNRNDRTHITMHTTATPTTTTRTTFLQTTTTATTPADTSTTTTTIDNTTMSFENTTKQAIFATTLRNQQTFALFEKELKRWNISCDYEDPMVIETLVPQLFPMYHIQPRSDVRICFMTKK